MVIKMVRKLERKEGKGKKKRNFIHPCPFLLDRLTISSQARVTLPLYADKEWTLPRHTRASVLSSYIDGMDSRTMGYTMVFAEIVYGTVGFHFFFTIKRDLEASATSKLSGLVWYLG